MTLQPCENIRRRWTEKDSHWNRTSGCPDVGLPVFRTVGDSFLLFMSQPVYGVLLQQPEVRKTWLDTKPSPPRIAMAAFLAEMPPPEEPDACGAHFLTSGLTRSTQSPCVVPFKLYPRGLLWFPVCFRTECSSDADSEFHRFRI